MSKTIIDWLAAREPVDAHSRSRELATAFAAIVAASDLIVDLGCGTGANFRFLDTYLGPMQRWLGIDNDIDLLKRAAACLPKDRVALKEMNLATDFQQVPFGKGFALTASAFLDMTSKPWLTRLAAHGCETPILIAMSTSSQPLWRPSHHLDEAIRLRVESRQRSDHGFGPSLGTDAANFLADLLRDAGCQVTTRESNWTLGPADRFLIAMMIEGVARRAQSIDASIDSSDWASMRKDQLLQNQLRLVVKHTDLLSIPPGHIVALDEN